jgi:hypothetical protein
MRDKEIRICKKCKEQFVYDKDSEIPKDIEYCSKCRGDQYSKTAVKIAKALESMLK